MSKQNSTATWITILLSVLFISGCTKPYRITHALNQDFQAGLTCVIGDIVDEFPVGVEESQKPTIEEVAKFRNYLAEELRKREILSLRSRDGGPTNYTIQASIFWYERGSGAARVLVGYFGAGDAECVVRLKLVDNVRNVTVFAGNFRAVVGNPFISGNKVFKKVSRDFCRQIEKCLKELAKDA